MKKIVFLLIVVLLGACSKGDVNVSVTDDGKTYKFVATFPKSHTARVVRFINRRIEPNQLDERASGTTTIATRLDDVAPFEMEVSKGEVEILFRKKEQSAEAFDLVKGFAEDLKKEVLKAK